NLRWIRWTRRWLRREEIAEGVGRSAIGYGLRTGRGLRFEQGFYAINEFLGLERLADELIGFGGHGFFWDGFIDDARHEDDWRGAEIGMLLDVAADGVAVLIGHDDVGDDDVGAIFGKLCEGGSSVGAGDDVVVLAAESDFDDFAHGGRVVDEVDRGRALGVGGFGVRRGPIFGVGVAVLRAVGCGRSF